MLSAYVLDQAPLVLDQAPLLGVAALHFQSQRVRCSMLDLRSTISLP
jgi:hypothetical protein